MDTKYGIWIQDMDSCVGNIPKFSPQIWDIDTGYGYTGSVWQYFCD